MKDVELTGQKTDDGKALYFLNSTDLAAIIDPQLPGNYFILFLAADFSRFSTDVLGDLAERMLDAGMVYVCTWGNDCERMHDIFDEIIVERYIESNDQSCVMTTWHSGDTFDEALWFAMNSAYPDELYESDCKEVLVIIDRSAGTLNTSSELLRSRI